MKIIASNKRSKFDYDITSEYTAGLVLTGAEVKSVKLGHISLKGSFITSHNNELFLVNVHISPYKFAPTDAFDPARSRKILLNKSEIKDIATSLSNKGYSVVPIHVFVTRGLVKLKIGVGKGRKKIDKRALITERLMHREAQKVIKNSSRNT